MNDIGKLAEWQAHKIVRAGKITKVDGYVVTVELPGVMGEPRPTERFAMDPKSYARGAPVAGMWLVVYPPDNYISFSPNDAFVAGYELRGKYIDWYLKDAPLDTVVTVTLDELNALIRRGVEAAAKA